MAKLSAGITGWGRGAVSGVQMQTMRGKTFIRAKQPPLGPGNANQQAYRSKFSFIQSQMKWPDKQIAVSKGYLSSVELDQRNNVLRQNLATMPWEETGKYLVCCDNYFWENIECGLFVDTDNNVYVDLYSKIAVSTKVTYTVRLYYKMSNGTFRYKEVAMVPSGLLIMRIFDSSIPSNLTITSILIEMNRYYKASSRPYLFAQAEIQGPNFDRIVKGSFTLKSTHPVEL